jgi:hypothetical protein
MYTLASSVHLPAVQSIWTNAFGVTYHQLNLGIDA